MGRCWQVATKTKAENVPFSTVRGFRREPGFYYAELLKPADVTVINSLLQLPSNHVSCRKKQKNRPMLLPTVRHFPPKKDHVLFFCCCVFFSEKTKREKKHTQPDQPWQLHQSCGAFRAEMSRPFKQAASICG